MARRRKAKARKAKKPRRSLRERFSSAKGQLMDYSQTIQRGADGVPALGVAPTVPALVEAAQREKEPIFRTPRSITVSLDGSNAQNIAIPSGAICLQISPRTAQTVQIAFTAGDSRIAGKYFRLTNGIPWEGRTVSGEYFEGLNLDLFAGVAVDVDVVFF